MIIPLVLAIYELLDFLSHLRIQITTVLLNQLTRHKWEEVGTCFCKLFFLTLVNHFLEIVVSIYLSQLAMVELLLSFICILLLFFAFDIVVLSLFLHFVLGFFCGILLMNLV